MYGKEEAKADHTIKKAYTKNKGSQKPKRRVNFRNHHIGLYK